MLKLFLNTGEEIEISEKQWAALEVVFNGLRGDQLFTIQGRQIRKREILGLNVTDLPLNPANPKPKFAIQRTITKLPSDATIPEPIRQLHADGHNVDWFFRRNK